MEVTIKHKQSIVDLNIQYNGNLTQLVRFAVDNGFSVSDDLQVGSSAIFNQDMQDELIVSFFKNNRVVVATEIEASSQTNRGIGYMAVFKNFRVG